MDAATEEPKKPDTPGYAARQLTPDEDYFLGLWAKLPEQAVTRENEALNRLITLSTGMAAGALVFLKDDVCAWWGRLAAATFFFVALACAMVGSIPVSRHVEYHPDAVRESLVSSADVKHRWVKWSSAVILAGFVAAMVGVAVKHFGG